MEYLYLKGTLVSSKTFKNDSLNGISKEYWIDGKTPLVKYEYFNGASKYNVKKYYKKGGKLAAELSYENGKLNGEAKIYYETGQIMQILNFRNGVQDGNYKYFHPNGQLWIEEIYKEGKEWTIIADFDSKGKPKDPGTLKEGNGTKVLYTEEGVLRETVEFVAGIEKK